MTTEDSMDPRIHPRTAEWEELAEQWGHLSVGEIQRLAQLSFGMHDELVDKLEKACDLMALEPVPVSTPRTAVNWRVIEEAIIYSLADCQRQFNSAMEFRDWGTCDLIHERRAVLDSALKDVRRLQLKGEM
jgi:hypothetical protein